MVHEPKSFLDLTVEEMELRILQREPSLNDLVVKSLHLLRLTINALARINAVKSAQDRPSEEFKKRMYHYIAQVANITQSLEETFFGEDQAAGEAAADNPVERDQ